jgi:hypothetical protein
MLYPLVHPTLSDVVILCEEAYEGYIAASRVATDGELATLFRTLGAARREMACTLAAFLDVSELPALPGGRDPDPDMAQRLFGRLKSVLGGDPRRILIERCERADRAFARCLGDIYEAGLPSRSNEQLRIILSEVTAALGLLAAARVRLA